MKKKKLSYIPNDFTKDMLPQTRRSQFSDIVKIRYRTLMVLGLLILCFAFLLLAKNFVAGYFNDAISLSIANGTVTEEEGEGARRILTLIASASNIVLYPVFFLGLAGSLRVVRQFCYSEGVIVGYEFKKGIKENAKHYVLVSLILALFQFGTTASLIFLPMTFISIALLVIFFILIVPTIIVSLFYAPIYINGLGKSLYHSLFVYLKSNWKTIVYVIIMIGPIIALELGVNLSLIKQMIYALLIVFVMPIGLVGGYCLYLDAFDKSFNIAHCPELVKKGLYIEPNKEEVK